MNGRAENKLRSTDIARAGAQGNGYGNGDDDVPDIVTLAVGVKEFYRKYVAFHSAHDVAQSGCMTLFTFYTYVYDEFRFAPILLVTAPTSEAGKTRLFDVAELLVRQPYNVVDPSGPGLRNVIDLLHPTLMVDEVDLLRKSRDLRAIFNAGVEQGHKIIRATHNGGVIEYDPFGPKMLAGIYGEEPPLKGPTLSRCIQIGLRRRYDGKEEIADFDKTDAEVESLPIARALKRWSLLASHDVLRKARPELPGELTDRQRDAWRPLIVIADLIGAKWAQAARQWAVEQSRAVPVTPDRMVQVLHDVIRVLASPEHAGDRVITTKVLAAARNALPDREYDEDLSPIGLAKRLARFEIRPTRYYAGTTQVRGFRIRDGSGTFAPEWADAIGRYRLADRE